MSKEWFINTFVKRKSRCIQFLIIPKVKYDNLVAACDVGLIFLDYRFTIPNFPSRVLTYMENSLPVIVCTDTHTDMGKIAESEGFGWWCGSNNVNNFTKIVDEVCHVELALKGKRAREYLMENYTSSESYEIIMGLLEEKS